MQAHLGQASTGGIAMRQCPECRAIQRDGHMTLIWVPSEAPLKGAK